MATTFGDGGVGDVSHIRVDGNPIEKPKQLWFVCRPLIHGGKEKINNKISGGMAMGVWYGAVTDFRKLP
jgi:hypothetical protein